MQEHGRIGSETSHIDTSVIVPAYDAADTIDEMLASLADQTMDAPWEVIVADNGSGDATLDIVGTYQNRIPNLRSIDASSRSGAAYARNEGVRHAQGRILVFVDADDVVASGWLAALRARVERGGMAASRFVGDVLNDAEALELRACPQQDGLMSFRYSPFLPFASASGLAMSREAFDTLGGFDPTLMAGEDIDLCWRAQLAGFELHFVDDAVLHYRLRGSVRDVFRQTMNYGYWTAPIYKRYRSEGMPYVSWRNGVKAWIRLVLRLPRLARSGSRGKWLKELAYRLGLLKGSVHFRVVAL